MYKKFGRENAKLPAFFIHKIILYGGKFFMMLSDAAREAQRAYQRAYKKAWYAANRDKVNAYQKKWRSKNKEKVAQYNREYWERKADAGFQQLREALGGGSNGC